MATSNGAARSEEGFANWEKSFCSNFIPWIREA